MTDDSGIPEVLRQVYDRAPEAAEPSDVLRARTIAALRERGLLRSRQSKRSGARMLVAAALVLLAFVGGYALGRGGEPSAVPTTADDRPIPDRTSDFVMTAEVVQGTGTSYALALEALLRELDEGSAADLATARHVVRAAAAAQITPTRRLLAPRGAEAEHEEDENDRDAPTTSDPALVWF